MYINDKTILEFINENVKNIYNVYLNNDSTPEQILHREAFYYILSGLYKDIKNSFNFGTFFEKNLSYEVNLF